MGMAQIIKFVPRERSNATLSEGHKAQIKLLAQTPGTSGAAGTARNAQLRRERHEAWHVAFLRMRYWEAAVTLHHRISCVQKMGAPEGRNHSPIDPNDLHTLVANREAATAHLLLTPAPRLDAVQWKRKILASGRRCGALTAAEIEAAIAEDEEFLASHPLRQSKAASEAVQ